MRRRGASEADDHQHAHLNICSRPSAGSHAIAPFGSVKVNPGQVQGKVRGWSRLSKDLKGDLRRSTSPWLTDLLTGLFACPRHLLRRPADALAAVPWHPHFSAPGLQGISRIDDNARRSVPSPCFAVDRGRNRVELPEVCRLFALSTSMRIYPPTYPNAGSSRSRRAEAAPPDALPPGAFRSRRRAPSRRTCAASSSRERSGPRALRPLAGRTSQQRRPSTWCSSHSIDHSTTRPVSLAERSSSASREPRST